MQKHFLCGFVNNLAIFITAIIGPGRDNFDCFGVFISSCLFALSSLIAINARTIEVHRIVVACILYKNKLSKISIFQMEVVLSRPGKIIQMLHDV